MISLLIECAEIDKINRNFQFINIIIKLGPYWMNVNSPVKKVKNHVSENSKSGSLDIEKSIQHEQQVQTI